MWVRWVSNRCALTKSLNALLPQPAYARDLVYVSPAKPRVIDGARTRGLRDTIRNSTLRSVLTCPSWSANSAYLSLICNFALIAFSVLVGSFLNLLLPLSEQVDALEGATNTVGNPLLGAKTWAKNNRKVVQPWINAAKQARQEPWRPRQ